VRKKNARNVRLKKRRERLPVQREERRKRSGRLRGSRHEMRDIESVRKKDEKDTPAMKKSGTERGIVTETEMIGKLTTGKTLVRIRHKARKSRLMKKTLKLQLLNYS